MFQYAHDCYARRQRPTTYIHLWRFLVGLSSLEAYFYEEGRTDMIDTRDGVLLDKAVEPEEERKVGGEDGERVPGIPTVIDLPCPRCRNPCPHVLTADLMSECGKCGARWL